MSGYSPELHVMVKAIDQAAETYGNAMKIREIN